MYSAQPDQTLPAASITKLLIAIAFAEVYGHAASAHSYRLIRSMIQISDNAAANALIEQVSVGEINRIAQSIGLKRTRIHGGYVSDSRNIPPRTFTTARDGITMLRYIVRKAQIETATVYRVLLSSMELQADRRFIPAVVPDGTTVANKTGEIHGTINDFAIINPRGENPLLMTLLVHGDFNIYRDKRKYNAIIAEIQGLSRCIYRASTTAR